MTAPGAIMCGDALDVLPRTLSPADGWAIVTSLPDAAETGREPEEWADWFRGAVALCCAVADPAVFYQTDRRAGGRLWSKADLVFRGAEDAGVRPLWHKIVLRRAPGSTDLYRPGYAHLIAVGRTAHPGATTPDVIAASEVLYPNGTPIGAAEVAIDYARRLEVAGVMDPFCGRGTIPRVALDAGVAAAGIDIDPDQCERARALLQTTVSLWRSGSGGSV